MIFHQPPTSPPLGSIPSVPVMTEGGSSPVDVQSRNEYLVSEHPCLTPGLLPSWNSPSPRGHETIGGPTSKRKVSDTPPSQT